MAKAEQVKNDRPDVKLTLTADEAEMVLTLVGKAEDLDGRNELFDIYTTMCQAGVNDSVYVARGRTYDNFDRSLDLLSIQLVPVSE